MKNSGMPSSVNEPLSSAQNPRIKHLLALQQKSQERRREGLFVVEGRRELEHCLEAGYEVESIVVSEELRVKSEEFATAAGIPEGNSSLFTLHSSLFTFHSSLFTFHSSLTWVTPKLYERIAYRGSTEGVMAIVRAKSHRLADLRLPDNPLIVVLESVEKPGNLGAVLRSADAAKADAVVVCDPLTDLYNPNLIRSSIGAIFTVPTVACTSEE